MIISQIISNFWYIMSLLQKINLFYCFSWNLCFIYFNSFFTSGYFLSVVPKNSTGTENFFFIFI